MRDYTQEEIMKFCKILAGNLVDLLVKNEIPKEDQPAISITVLFGLAAAIGMQYNMPEKALIGFVSQAYGELQLPEPPMERVGWN